MVKRSTKANDEVTIHTQLPTHVLSPPTSSGLEMEWDYSGRKRKDGLKKKISKAHKKRKKGKSKKEQKMRK